MKYTATPAANAQVAAASADLRYYGFNARETSGAPASLIIHHGIGPGDPALSTITLAAKESRNDWPEEGGTAAPNGIFIEWVSGSIELNLYYRN